jgi:hypothetical protein
VLGYDPTGLSIPKAFESTSVLIKANKYLKEDGGWPQVVAYMVVQQHALDANGTGATEKDMLRYIKNG